MIKTDVIIIGGGATGCGIARDLALRGIPHCLIEKGDFAAGATGPATCCTAAAFTRRVRSRCVENVSMKI